MNQLGYSIIEELGTGSFGTVYKCLHKGNSICCIKKMRVNHSHNAWRDQVRQEIYLLQNLKHPRIIKFLQHFYTTNHAYIVMEYACNGPLSKYLQEKRDRKSFLNENDAIRLFIDVLVGIEYLHMKNVIHKDIKSDNILIAADGRLKLADFGVSRIINVQNDDFKQLLTSQKSETMGTPSYMAPETLVHNQFSFASDVWALGCFLYELCKLEPPFWSAKSMNELVQLTTEAIYEPINGNSLVTYAPKMVSLCSSMLVPDPAKRATICDIIANDLIAVKYYRSLFDYGYRLPTAESADSNNNNVSEIPAQKMLKFS